MDILAIFLCLTAPFAIFKVWWWFWTMVIIGVVIGLVEVIAKIKTGKTMSQMFWRWGETNKTKALIVIGSLAIGWTLFLLHLILGVF